VDLATLGVHVARHALHDQLDVGGVLADVGILELVDGCLDGGAEGIERALPHSVEALVGIDTDEKPVLPWVSDQEGLNATDLHERS